MKLENTHCNKETTTQSLMQAKLACSLDDDCLGYIRYPKKIGYEGGFGLCFHALQETPRAEEDGVVYRKIVEYGKI